MIHDLLKGSRHAAAVSSRVVLVMGSPYASDLLYHDDLRELASKHSNFTYLTAISRERQEGDDRPLYVQDRLATHRDMLGALLNSSRTLIYVCGIAGMELGIFQGLARYAPASALEGYLQVDPTVAGDINAWDRKMIHKLIKPTRRVFLEVY